MSEPKTDRPTGTIFELDIFREKLERKAHDYGTRIHPATPEAIEQHLLELAAELKTLIDNCMKQYVHTASPESAPIPADFLFSDPATINNTPTPSPPTPPTEGEAEGPILTEQNDGFLVAGKPVFTEFGYDPDDLSKSDRDLLDAVATAAYAAGASTRGSGEAMEQRHFYTGSICHDEIFEKGRPEWSCVAATAADAQDLVRTLNALAAHLDQHNRPENQS